MKQVDKSLKLKSGSRKQSVITVFEYVKYINNKLKNRNIVVRGKVTISATEQNDTCTSI